MRRSRKGFGLVLAGAIGGLIALAAVACGNGANDVSGCQTLENARCARAAKCGIDLSFPLHTGDTEADGVTACQLFYQDACLHGFVTTAAITNKQVMQCQGLIESSGDCNVVLNPQDFPLCSWLNPPDAGVDAGTDAATTTADAVVVVVSVDSSTGDAGSDAETLEACYLECEDEDGCSGEPSCNELCEQTCQAGS